MWLLSTDCVELRFFASPELVEGGYVILSHTWGDKEQSFQDIQELQKRCSTSGENPRNVVSPKIRGCCLLAEKHGYEWAWIDSCCIDKTSSSELSEAINSMFLWYTCAEVCYAFLEDVPSNCALRAKGSAFRRARWHTRGWTLQELIAPALLIFVSQDWTPIGQKNDLAPLLEQITSVRSEILTREVSFLTVSIAERMSWASLRNTTRVEDEAYCLMGLFDVNMPTLYGEGRRAFQRLQHEIMKTSFDTSLFAWDDERLTSLPIDDGGVRSELPPLVLVQSHTSNSLHGYPLAYSPHIFRRPSGESPSAFTPSCPNPMQPYPPPQMSLSHQRRDTDERKGPFGTLELPRFSLTNHGIQCRFPVIEVNEDLAIAVLLCETRNSHVGLLLHPAGAGHHVQDLTRPTYLCGYLLPNMSFHRLVDLGPDLYHLRFRGYRMKARWRDFFLLTTLPPWRRDEALNIHAPFNSILPAPPFRIPQWLLGRLKAANFQHRPLQYLKVPNLDDPTFHALVNLYDGLTGEAVDIFLGTCIRPGQRRPHHWATVFISHQGFLLNRTPDSPFEGHTCSEDHLKYWEACTKEFGDSERRVRLSFSPCKLTPDTTFVLHMELEGSVYSAMKGSGKNTLSHRAPA